jgi:hypothetical protein
VVGSHTYQLDFVTPGRRPTDANSRKQIRQSPNFRMYARLRPQRWQRFTCRVSNLAGPAALTIKHFLAIQVPPTRLAGGLDGSLRSGKWHAEQTQQSPPFFISLRAGHEAELETATLIDFVVVDLRERDLLLKTQRVIASTVE